MRKNAQTRLNMKFTKLKCTQTLNAEIPNLWCQSTKLQC